MTNDGAPLGKTHSWIRSNILGLVAIFIALSGSAVAANVAEDPGKAVAAAKKKKKKPKAIPGPQGPQGPQGPAGTPGTARAYAYISAGGSVSQASGIAQANVNHASATSPYCFGSLGFTPQSISVTPGFVNATNPVGAFVADTGANGANLACPEGFRQAIVAAFDDGNPFGTYDQRPFYVVFN